MALFVYSTNGHDAVIPYAARLGGRVVSTDVDALGGTLSVFPHAFPAQGLIFADDPTVLALSLHDMDDPIPEAFVDILAKLNYGIVSGDTLRQALKKVRAVRNGDPHFLP